MTSCQEPTRTTPRFEVITKRGYTYICYDFWRTHVDLTHEAANAIHSLFNHAVHETFRLGRRRKAICYGAGPTIGYVTVDQRLADTLIGEMKDILSRSAYLRPHDWKDL